MTLKSFRQKAAFWVLAAVVALIFMGVTPDHEPVFAGDCVPSTSDHC